MKQMYVRKTICREMIRLRNWLDKNNIEWVDKSSVISDEQFGDLIGNDCLGLPMECFDTSIFRTHFKYNNHKVSVIYGYGTYGGFSPEKKDYKLLEMRIDDNEPDGWLTADDVINKFTRLNEN